MLKFQSIKPRPPKQFRLFRSLNAQVNSKRQPSSPEKNTFVFKEPFGIQKNQLFRFLSMGMISCSTFMLCSSLSFAQNQTSSLEEIVIVANRVPIPIKKVGSSVSILNLEEIQEATFPSLIYYDRRRQLELLAMVESVLLLPCAYAERKGFVL